MFSAFPARVILIALSGELLQLLMQDLLILLSLKEQQGQVERSASILGQERNHTTKYI